MENGRFIRRSLGEDGWKMEDGSRFFVVGSRNFNFKKFQDYR